MTRALALLCIGTALAALTIAVIPGAAPAVRAALNFEVAGHRGTPSEAAAIAWTNLRFGLALQLAAVARQRVRRIGRLLDATVAIMLGTNTVLVGAALGAYGPAAIPFLPHLGLEWTGLAVPLSAYMNAAGGRPVRINRSTLTLPLLLLAAVVETFATPQR